MAGYLGISCFEIIPSEAKLCSAEIVWLLGAFFMLLLNVRDYDSGSLFIVQIYLLENLHWLEYYSFVGLDLPTRSIFVTSKMIIPS